MASASIAASCVAAAVVEIRRNGMSTAGSAEMSQNSKGRSEHPVSDCIAKIQERRVHRDVWTPSIRGDQKNLKTHGKTRTEVSMVIVLTSIPAMRNFVGRAHQINPMGAPSLR